MQLLQEHIMIYEELNLDFVAGLRDSGIDVLVIGK